MNESIYKYLCFMIRINFNGKELEVESSWDELGLKRYFEIFNGLEDETNVIHREAVIISRILGVKIEDILNLPIDEYNRLAEEFAWLYKLDLEDQEYLEIDGVQYKFLPKEKMSTAKYIDIDTINKSEGFCVDEYDKWLTLLSIALEVGEEEDYSGFESRQELKTKLESLSAVKILPFLNFFFKCSLKSIYIADLSLMADILEKSVNEAKSMMSLLEVTNG